MFQRVCSAACGNKWAATLMMRRRFSTDGLPKASSATVPAAARAPSTARATSRATSAAAATGSSSFGTSSAKGAGTGYIAQATRKVGSIQSGVMAHGWVSYIVHNGTGLALYQLLLESSITGFWMWMISSGRTTPEAIQRRIEKYGLKWLIDMDHCVWENDVHLREGVVIPKDAATLWSRGHAFSTACMPLQVPLVLWSYPMVSKPLFKLWQKVKPPPMAMPVTEATQRKRSAKA